MTSIYCLEENNISFYIGKTTGNWRKRIHQKIHGEDIKYYEIDKVHNNDWKFWESYWIEQFKCWGFKLENKNNGGGGPSSYTEEQKQKMRKPHAKGTGNKISKALKGKKRTYEQRKKQSLAKMGKSLTFEHKQNISKSNKGRKITWSHKISKALKNIPKNYPNPNKKPIQQLDLNGTLIKTFPSATDAGKHLNKSGNSIADCASGRQKTAYGFKWKYLES